MTLSEVILFGVQVISKVAAAIAGAGQGTLTPEEALRQIGEANKQDQAVDARVDAAIDAKFPK